MQKNLDISILCSTVASSFLRIQIFFLELIRVSLDSSPDDSPDLNKHAIHTIHSDRLDWLWVTWGLADWKKKPFSDAKYFYGIQIFKINESI